MIDKHGDRGRDSVIYNHITNSKSVNYLVELLKINHNCTEREQFDRKFLLQLKLRKIFALIIKPKNGTFYYLKKTRRLEKNT